MKKKRSTLHDLVEQLPPQAQREVIDFVEFLLSKWGTHSHRKSQGAPKFKWAGALKDLKEKYTSVELQHELANWRNLGD